MGDEYPARRPPLVLVDSDSSQREIPLSQSQQGASTSQPQQLAMEFAPHLSQHFGTGPYSNPQAFNMGSIANFLPDYQSRSYGQQPFQQQLSPPGGQNPAIPYQIHQGAQFAGQTATSFAPNFSQQYPAQSYQAQQYHTSNMNYPHFQNTASNNPQSFQNQQFYSQQPMIQRSSFAPQNQPVYHTPHTHYGTSPVARIGSGFQPPELRLDSNSGQVIGLPYPQYPNQSLSHHSSESSLRPSVPRGPPRKPKQSGHALWVGNLPPGTNVMDLKDHFSRDATSDIESVFLISKSNCAFVNYKTEASCSSAMSRFHDSRFQGVRLVCRLRRGSTPTSATAPGGPSPGTSTSDPQFVTGEQVDEPASEEPPIKEEGITERVKDKFFIVKSLTTEDLELSVRNGIWATQAHNETALNKAYQTAENVYLIFSANKSGEYFGYARMVSAITNDAAAMIEVPARQALSEPVPADLPVTIPTAATATAPKGQIIDDSARGTIFWEADPDPESEEQKVDDTGNTSGEGEESGGLSPGNPQAFGKPFKITWMSTEKLPFYRTRGLRNPWNANREVKIARDGTELEPSVGRRLTGMFHRPQMPSSSPNATRQQIVMGGGGYQQQQQQQQQYQQRHY